MLPPAGDPVVDVGAEIQAPAGGRVLDLKLDREKRRVVDRDPAFLDRRYQEILVAFALEHRGEQFDQRGAPDWGLLIKPGAVGGDAHVDIAAIGRIPQVDRRQALAARAARLARDPLQPRSLYFLRHGAPLQRSYIGRGAIVPRTRSSHHNCRSSGCELRVQSGTRIIELLVSFASEVRIGRAASAGELRNRDTSLLARS